MIEDQLSHTVKMLLDPGDFEFVGPSTIISFYPNDIELLRVGAGATAPFGF
jgi:tRNA A37 threonylcarbamoyladenosine synthetase subunit TsaC/SUA5/YrdC